MAKYSDSVPLKCGDLLGIRVRMDGHGVWHGQEGEVVTHYSDGSVLAKLTDRNVHAKAKEGEFKVLVWSQRNIPIRPLPKTKAAH